MRVVLRRGSAMLTNRRRFCEIPSPSLPSPSSTSSPIWSGWRKKARHPSVASTSSDSCCSDFSVTLSPSPPPSPSLLSLPPQILSRVAASLDPKSFIAFRSSCKGIKSSVGDVFLNSPSELTSLSLRASSQSSRDCIQIKVHRLRKKASSAEQEDVSVLQTLQSVPSALGNLRLLCQCFRFSALYLTDVYLVRDVLSALGQHWRRSPLTLLHYTETAFPSARFQSYSDDQDGRAFDVLLEQLAPSRIHLMCSRFSARPWAPSPRFFSSPVLVTASDVVLKLSSEAGSSLDDNLISSMSAMNLQCFMDSSCSIEAIRRILEDVNAGFDIRVVILRLKATVDEVRAACEEAGMAIRRRETGWYASFPSTGSPSGTLTLRAHSANKGGVVSVELKFCEETPEKGKRR